MDWDPGVSFDVLMARISSNVRASTSRVKGDAEYVSGSWDLSAIRELFDEVVPGSGGWASSTTAWMVAAILRYCDDAGAPVTPDVFGSAVLGFQRVFSCQPPGTFLIEGFPFEEQLREDAVVAWACWTAWYICVRDGSRKGWPAALLTSSSTPSSFSLLRAMVCCHAPRPDYLGSRHFDQMMVYLRGSLLLVDESMLRSSFGRWYSGQCAQSCLALADQAHVTRGEQLMALTELADAADGTQRTHQGNEEFVLAATSALTRAGGLILSPEAASEVLRVLSFSTQRFSSTYRSLIQSLMAVYIDMPAHADMVLDRWELFDPRVALSVLLPACHSLSASTITSKLAPICLDLLQECHRKAMQDEGGSSSGLLRLLQDVYLHGILTSPSLATEDMRCIGLSLVDVCPASNPAFSLSACVGVLVLAHDGALASDILDRLSERAWGADAEGDGAFRALADALDVVRLEEVPGVCARLASRVCGRPDSNERLASLRRFIEACPDLTRKEYLVAWYCDIVE